MSFPKLCTLLISAAFALAGGRAFAEMHEIVGTITDVDLADENITVELEDGTQTTFDVDAETDITIYGNIGRNLDELHSGQHVTLEVDEMPNERVIIHVISVPLS